MISMGQVLYEIYIDAQLSLNNCSVDSWNDLTSEDKLAWEVTAENFIDKQS